jgi:sortase A
MNKQYKKIGVSCVSTIGFVLLVFLVFSYINSPTVIEFIAPKTEARGIPENFITTPRELRIDAIEVDAKVQTIGVTPKGNLGIPTNFTDVGWYKDGPFPGQKGSAVIVGHLNGPKIPHAVFYELDKLKVDDIVTVVDGSGNTLTFKVVKSKIYNYDASTEEIFDNDRSKARLNLITCTGDWIQSQKLYNKRLVVFTELVDAI